MTDRILTKEQNAAIVAHFSYELEPRTELPDWNAVAMETVYLHVEIAALSAALQDMQGHIDHADAYHMAMETAEARVAEQAAEIARLRGEVAAERNAALDEAADSLLEAIANLDCARGRWLTKWR